MRVAPSVTWGQRVSRHVGPAAPSPAHGQEESRVCKRPCSAGKLPLALCPARLDQRGRRPGP